MNLLSRKREQLKGEEDGGRARKVLAIYRGRAGVRCNAAVNHVVGAWRGGGLELGDAGTRRRGRSNGWAQVIVVKCQSLSSASSVPTPHPCFLSTQLCFTLGWLAGSVSLYFFFLHPQPRVWKPVRFDMSDLMGVEVQVVAYTTGSGLMECH